MPKSKAPTFEESFKTLDELVRQLEAGELPLAEAISVYEKGMTLAAHLEAQLAQAELRVRKVQANATSEDITIDEDAEA